VAGVRALRRVSSGDHLLDVSMPGRSGCGAVAPRPFAERLERSGPGQAGFDGLIDERWRVAKEACARVCERSHRNGAIMPMSTVNRPDDRSGHRVAQGLVRPMVHTFLTL
jgi:hypothetical protein